MVEGILILVGVTSYVSIVKACSEHRDSYGSRLHDNDWFWIRLVFGWLLVRLPEQIKERSRKKK